MSNLLVNEHNFAIWNLPLNMTDIGLLSVIVIIAGAVRGFAGFGLSAVTVTLGSIWFDLRITVPLCFLIEIIASVHMLKSVYRQIDRLLLSGLIIGCAIGMPLGQTLLLVLPIDTTRALLYGLVICSVVIIQLGYGFSFNPTARAGAVIGIAAGISSGLASIGGLITMVALLGTNYDVSRARATLVAMFFVLYTYGTAIGLINGVMTVATFQIAAVMFIPLVFGVVIGQKGYLITSPEKFRQIMLWLLAVIAVIGAFRVIFHKLF